MSKPKSFAKIQRNTLRLSICTIALLCAVGNVPPAQAQTFSVIHTFTGGSDGWWPYAGLTIDQGGNLYGTTSEFSSGNAGTAFEMRLRNGFWTFTTLSDFSGRSTARVPQGRLIVGPGGALYGTTLYGGNDTCFEFGCGSVYALRPPRTVCRSSNCEWSDSPVFGFPGNGTLGWGPQLVDPAFDAAGNLYGTTQYGGSSGNGNVFELTRVGGVWNGVNIHSFNVTDGFFPQNGVTLDAEGNVYGPIWQGGSGGWGAIFELTNTGGGWSETALYNFQCGDDGGLPSTALIFDHAGNLYGATERCGSGGGGTVFELSPSGSGWTYNVLYSFVGPQWGGPVAALMMDASGNLYGTTVQQGAFGYGTVFKLTRNNGSWTYTDLHDFTNGDDGAYPISEVVMDASGNLYGTASQGGDLSACSGGCGTVWKIAP